MPDDIKNISLADLVPDSIKGDEKVSAATKAIDDELKAVSRLCEIPALFDRLDELGHDELDHLAWQIRVDVWHAGLSLQNKRDLIRKAIEVHRKKGTPWAVQQAMDAAGVPLDLQEWFSYGGDPFYFRVRVTAVTDPLSREMVSRLMGDIERYKNVRSWGSLRLAQEGDMEPLFCRIGIHVRPEITVLPYKLSIELTNSQYQYFSGTRNTRGRVVID